MTRRLLLLATLMTLALTGCVTYSDSYYRQSQYRDGGYYYPAQDGYGDYYQGREPRYNDYYYDSYTPFWGLSRYSCAGYYSCSPFWNGYYGRPYSGWNLSFGSHYNYGSWGWYGNHWAPWGGPGYYGHRPHRPQPRQPPPPGGPADPRDPYLDDRGPQLPSFGVNQGRPGPRPIDEEPQGYRPGYGRNRGNGGDIRPEPIGGVEMAPVPRAGFRPGGKAPAPLPDVAEDVRRMPRANFGKDPGGPLPEPGVDYRQAPPRSDYRQVQPQPEYREVERYEPREVERYEPREVERYEPREVERYEPREVERYEPEPRMERSEPQEMSFPSQNEESREEQ